MTGQAFLFIGMLIFFVGQFFSTFIVLFMNILEIDKIFGVFNLFLMPFIVLIFTLIWLVIVIQGVRLKRYAVAILALFFMISAFPMIGYVRHNYFDEAELLAYRFKFRLDREFYENCKHNAQDTPVGRLAVCRRNMNFLGIVEYAEIYDSSREIAKPLRDRNGLWLDAFKSVNNYRWTGSADWPEGGRKFGDDFYFAKWVRD